MNVKTIAAGAAVLGAVMLAGCSSQQAAQQQPQALSPDQVSSPAHTPAAGNGVSDWVAGLAAGKRMSCQYAMSGQGDSKLSVKMFADKDHYRTETVTPAGTMISLSDGKTMYTWTGGSKQGMKMDLECAKSLKNDLPKTGAAAPTPPQTYDTPESAVGSIPDISCSETTEAVDFSVPSDVTFTDQCAMLKGALGKIPAGATTQIPDNVKNMMNGR